jgi:homocysteine S-methyltransferase
MNAVTESFESLLASGDPIILDGGLATELEAQGHVLGTNLWSAELLRNNPQSIIDAHRAYFEAGANCTISASYQATISGFIALGLSPEDAKALILKSVELAIIAREEFLRANPDIEIKPLVAASIGPYGASLSDGSEYTGDYKIDDTGLIEFHYQRLHWLDNSDADILACETIPCLQEAKVLHTLLTKTNTPSWVSFSCKDDKHLVDGTPIKACAILFAEHTQVKALGINCTSPVYINSLIKEIKEVTPQQNIVVYPNSGEVYKASDNSWHGIATPLECGQAAKTWMQNGANIIGGCCGMGPAHISKIKRSLIKGRIRRR